MVHFSTFLSYFIVVSDLVSSWTQKWKHQWWKQIFTHVKPHKKQSQRWLSVGFWCLLLLITLLSDLQRVHPLLVSLEWLLFAADTDDTSGYYLLLIQAILFATDTQDTSGCFLLLIHREDTPRCHYLLAMSIVRKDYLISRTCLDTNYQSLPCELWVAPCLTLPAYLLTYLKYM